MSISNLTCTTQDKEKYLAINKVCLSAGTLRHRDAVCIELQWMQRRQRRRVQAPGRPAAESPPGRPPWEMCFSEMVTKSWQTSKQNGVQLSPYIESSCVAEKWGGHSNLTNNTLCPCVKWG